MSILVRTLSDQVFDVVRERIVTGRLADGAIRQDALATELGVSKIPLREALARLEQEGLLTNHANRGYFVQPMSAEQADELFELRVLVEPPAAARAALAADAEERDRVIAAYDRLDSAAANNLAEVAFCNREFHTALVAPGHRLLTTQLVERLAVLAERYVIAHLQPAGRDARAHLEHRHLLDAWLGRDGARVTALLADHLNGTRDDLRAQFAQAGASIGERHVRAT